VPRFAITSLVRRSTATRHSQLIRLRFRTLDVEQIGSVYETVRRFNLEVAEGRLIAVSSPSCYR
jgi:hypothetical protein